MTKVTFPKSSVPESKKLTHITDTEKNQCLFGLKSFISISEVLENNEHKITISAYQLPSIALSIKKIAVVGCDEMKHDTLIDE